MGVPSRIWREEPGPGGTGQERGPGLGLLWEGRDGEGIEQDNCNGGHRENCLLEELRGAGPRERRRLQIRAPGSVQENHSSPWGQRAVAEVRGACGRAQRPEDHGAALHEAGWTRSLRVR